MISGLKVIKIGNFIFCVSAEVKQ